MKNKTTIFAIVLILTSVLTIASNVKADCAPDQWTQCEGSYAVQYFIFSDCSTTSDSSYCDYGCSGGSCNSAPSYPTYTPSTTYYPTYTSTYYPTYYPTYTPSYFYQPCYQQYINNYRCNGNDIQEEYQFSDCSTTWYTVQTCQYSCFNNNQCMSQQTQTQTQTQTVTSTQTIQQCVLHATGNYQCVNNQQQAQYQYPDCSFQWVTQMNCQNGCNGQFCAGASMTSTSTTTYTSTVTTTYQPYTNYYPYPYQVPYYYYQYYQYPYYQTYNYARCTAATTNNYQCSGNVRQVQYQNSDCSTYWQTLETCPNGCSNGVCLQSTSTSTVTVVQQTSYMLTTLGALALILVVMIVAVILIRCFGRNQRMDSKYEPEYWR